MIAPRRLLPRLLAFIALVSLALPPVASAHGIVGRANLPIPVWLFSWAAAVVLVASFVALSSLWTTPRLQEQRRRRLFKLPRAVDVLANVVGLGLFVLTVYSGFAGAQVAQANFADTFIFVIFWIGIPVLSVLVGDLFKAFNPWRTCARVIWWAGRLLAPRALAAPRLRYPRWLGMWPAIAGLVGFAWLELVYLSRERPSVLAALSLGYFLAMLVGMLLFGVEEWGERADAFGVYFGILARLSALTRDENGVLWARQPLSGVTDLPMRRGTIALICTMIGTTIFDGFSNGGVWRTDGEPLLQELFSGLGFHQIPAIELSYSVGLIFCICLVGAVYRIGILGVHSVSTLYDSSQLARTFAHALVPIAFAYVVAHYFSLLIWQSQALVYLASDPLGNGSNLFGSSGYEINYSIISYAGIWYVQVAALLAGHVAGLALAHDRALALYSDPQEAVRSQYWMLVVMVAFTSFGLWLLSAVGT
jgi:hypothetical protein